MLNVQRSQNQQPAGRQLAILILAACFGALLIYIWNIAVQRLDDTLTFVVFMILCYPATGIIYGYLLTSRTTWLKLVIAVFCGFTLGWLLVPIFGIWASQFLNWNLRQAITMNVFMCLLLNLLPFVVFHYKWVQDIIVQVCSIGAITIISGVLIIGVSTSNAPREQIAWTFWLLPFVFTHLMALDVIKRFQYREYPQS